MFFRLVGFPIRLFPLRYLLFRQVQEELVLALSDAGIDRRYDLVHERQLIHLVPFADRHRLYLLLLLEFTAADEAEEITLDYIHFL